MQWTNNYQLYLFDFDGLLVDSEPYHYRAFCQMLQEKNHVFDLPFEKYLGFAHRENDGVRKLFSSLFPNEKILDATWQSYRKRVKEIYVDLIVKEPLSLMEGVAPLLTFLDKQSKKKVVVTNSTKQQTEIIKEKLPLLQTIDHWITREKIKEPKPSPEGYQLALDRYRENEEAVIGFEDSFKGLTALSYIDAKRVLVCSSSHPQMELVPQAVAHFESISQISVDGLS